MSNWPIFETSRFTNHDFSNSDHHPKGTIFLNGGWVPGLILFGYPKDLFLFRNFRFAEALKRGQANIYSLDPGRRNSSFHYLPFSHQKHKETCTFNSTFKRIGSDNSAGDLVKWPPMWGYKGHGLNHQEDLFLLGTFISIHLWPLVILNMNVTNK